MRHVFHLPGFQKGQQPLRDSRPGQKDAPGIRRQGAEEGQYSGVPILIIVNRMEVVQYDDSGGVFCRLFQSVPIPQADVGMGPVR